MLESGQHDACAACPLQASVDAKNVLTSINQTMRASKPCRDCYNQSRASERTHALQEPCFPKSRRPTTALLDTNHFCNGWAAFVRSLKKTVWLDYAHMSKHNGLPYTSQHATTSLQNFCLGQFYIFLPLTPNPHCNMPAKSRNGVMAKRNITEILRN